MKIKAICIFMMLLSGIVSNSQSITVNSTNYKQTIDMIGGDIERNSIAVQNAQNKNEIIDWGFKDIAFNYCRVQFDKNQELVEGTKNWSFYTKQVATMQRIKLANPNIRFFATMRTDYDGFGTENNMPDWIINYTTKAIEIDKYAIFLADYLEYMNNQGVAIHTMSITKEWTSFVYASRADKIITKLKSECIARNIPMPLISDQGFWSISQGIGYIDDVATRGSKDQYDSFCSHDYQNEGSTKWTTIIGKANALGKKLYNDEFSTGSGAATSGVEPAMSKPIGVYIDKAVAYQAGLNGEIFFEIWSRGINTETRAIYYPSNGTGRRIRGYYIMKHFSNNILDSRYITATVNSMSNVYTISFRKDNKMVLWVINKGTTTYTAPIQMDQSTITSQVDTQYWTNDSPIEGTTTSYAASGNTFIPTIKGESMNCYIFNVTEDVLDTCSLAPTTLIEAECYTDMVGVEKEACSEGTADVTAIENGDWLKFKDFNLGSGATQFSARVASTTTGGTIELRTDSPTGTLVGTLNVTNTGGVQNWKTVTATIPMITGVKDLYFVFKGATASLFNVNWFKLEATPSVVLTATSSGKSVALSWTLGNVTLGSQNVYRNTYLSEAGRTLIAENVTGSSFTDTTVNIGQTYWYSVEATDASSVVTKSNFVAVTPSLPNLALASNGSVATQSTTAYSAPPEFANDGNTDGDFAKGSVSHTEQGTNGSNTLKWWQVDLQNNYKIETIIIYNRTGSTAYSERLNNFTVEVIDSNNNITFSQLYTSYPNPSQTIAVGGVLGRVVRISKTSDYAISLAEVEVYGTSSSLSNNSFDKNSSIQIYPNPVKNVFNITKSAGADLAVYSVAGKLLLNKNIENDAFSVDVSQFKKGIYFVRVTNNGVVSTQKIIKE